MKMTWLTNRTLITIAVAGLMCSLAPSLATAQMNPDG